MTSDFQKLQAAHETLKQYLEKNQGTKNQEVIDPANDASSDETLSIMEGFQQENNTIKIVNVKNIEAFYCGSFSLPTLGKGLVCSDQYCVTRPKNRDLNHD